MLDIPISNVLREHIYIPMIVSISLSHILHPATYIYHA